MTEEEILNIGIELTMEFGKNWLEPIQNRLSRKVPELTNNQLENYNKICKATMNDSHDFIYKRLVQITDENKTISEENLLLELRKFLNHKYSWVNDKNISFLYSQGIYYAFKDGLDKCIS